MDEQQLLFDWVNHKIRHTMTAGARNIIYYFLHTRYNGLTLNDLREVQTIIYLSLAYERGIYGGHKISTSAFVSALEVIHNE